MRSLARVLARVAEIIPGLGKSPVISEIQFPSLGSNFGKCLVSFCAVERVSAMGWRRPVLPRSCYVSA